MSVFKRGEVYWYEFVFAGQRIQESSKSKSKTVAREAERRRRRELEEGYNNVASDRSDRIRRVRDIAAIFLADYSIRHPRSKTFAEYAIKHIVESLGTTMIVDVNDESVKAYQRERLRSGASPKTINEEVGFLLRLLGDVGDAIRLKLRRDRSLKLAVRETTGKVFSPEQQVALLRCADTTKPNLPNGEKRTRSNPGTRSPFIAPALALALGCGMRHKEMRTLRWKHIDLEKRIVTVGESKTLAGEGRTVPMADDVYDALTAHAKWYQARFGFLTPEWYVFPGRIASPQKGKPRPYDPTRPTTSFKTAWRNVRRAAGVDGRLHDARHTVITELAENPSVSDETIRQYVGHVSPRMLGRYSHIRMAAKRDAADVLAERRAAAAAAGVPTKVPTVSEIG